MKRSRSLPLAILAAVCLAGQLPTAHAEIVISGGVAPVNAGDWNSETSGYVGQYADGELEINGGSGLQSYSGRIGYRSDSTGMVTIDGAGSTWVSSQYLYVGDSGSGTLNVTGGAVVSGILEVGRAGSGTLHVTSGAAVSSTRGYIGRLSNSMGVVTVDGAGSTWIDNEILYVGNSGNGTLNITGGAVVSSSHGYIGENFGSTSVVTVDGAGSTWTNSDNLYVGRFGNGTLNIASGGEVSSSVGYVGRRSGSTGVVAVDGDGAMWTNGSDLYVGHSGSGTLSISNGANVSTVGSTHVAYEAGSTGLIQFGTGSGTLMTGSLLASPTQLAGTGTVNTRGLVSDVELVFDSTAGLTQTLVFNSQPNQNVALHLDMAGDPTSNGPLGAGWEGHGSLAIQDGLSVNSTLGYIGYHSGSTGAVTVDGSNWANSDDLYVGHSGSGTLHITGGAAVSNSVGYVGYDSGSTGAVMVDGAGSTWSNSGDLYVGYKGGGTLDISGGAVVSIAGATHVTYEPSVTGSINFGTGSGMLTTGALCASPTQLSGTGTINTHGLLSDIDLVFDSAASLTQTLVFDTQPDQDVTLHLDMANDASNNGVLGAGWRGHGSLAIRDGVTINSDGGYIGYLFGSMGVVTVEGAESTWTNGENL
ncbi:MAG: hypothetical protein HQ567_24100, partial [Candidatus Nealsonbacteria bacterium]|nr:hypothetical protein [Candidatus Nealsonbacteria bacterium]